MYIALVGASIGMTKEVAGRHIGCHRIIICPSLQLITARSWIVMIKATDRMKGKTHIWVRVCTSISTRTIGLRAIGL